MPFLFISVRVCVHVSVSNLLHVTQDVLPAVKHSSALLRVELVDEVSGEVLVAVLVSGKTNIKKNTLMKTESKKKKKSWTTKTRTVLHVIFKTTDCVSFRFSVPPHAKVPLSQPSRPCSRTYRAVCDAPQPLECVLFQ